MRLSIVPSIPEQTGIAVFGPVIYYFTDWLCRQAIKNNIDKLFFLAREGFFLKEFYDYYSNLPGIRKKYPNLPESCYYLCSRRALFGSIPKNIETLKNIISYKEFGGSLFNLLKVRTGFEGVNPRFSKEIHIPKDTEKVLKAIKPFIPEMNRQARLEQDALRKYSEDSGMFSCRNPGLVDIGYSASIQKLLYKLFPTKLHGFYFITKKSVKSWENDENRTSACFGEFQPENSVIPVFYYSLILESFLISPEGQLHYFVKEGEKVIPKYGPLIHAHKFWPVILRIIEGVKTYMRLLLPLDCNNNNINLTSVTAQELFRLAVITSYWDNESKEIFHVEDHFTGRGELDILKHLSRLPICPIHWDKTLK